MTEPRRPLIDGRFGGSGPALGVEDPATGKQFTEVATATSAEIDQAVRAARRAFDEGPWPRLTIRERVAALARMSDWLEERRDALLDEVISETGCPLVAARPGQIDMPLAFARQLPALLERQPQWEHNEMPLDDYFAAPGKMRRRSRPTTIR